MKKLKKILCIFIFVMAIGMIWMTKSEAKTMDQLRNEYPNGGVWTGGGYCNGFALNIFKEYYGASPSLIATKITDKNEIYNIQAGDIVRYKYNGVNKHSVWIISRNGDTVGVAEANYDKSNGIRWTTKYISEFSDLEYIYKAPYRADQARPNINPPTNIRTEILSDNSIQIRWNEVSNASGYLLKIYKKQDVDNNNYSNPVLTSQIDNAVNGNYNYKRIDLSETGEYCAFVHTEIGDLTSPSGGTPAKFYSKAISSIKINTSKSKLMVGESCEAAISFEPSDANNKHLIIGVNNENLATYHSATGSITAKKTGIVEFFARADNGVNARIKIEIVDGTPASYFTLNTTSKDIKVGERFQIKITSYSPENAVLNTTYTNENEDIILVDENGYVTGLKEGKGRVMVNCGNMGMAATFTVIPGTKITSLTLDKDVLNLKVNERATVRATIAPSDATNKTATWTSSNEKVATVNNGVVNAVGEGTAIITARTLDGTNISKSCTVNVLSANFKEKYINLPLAKFVSYDDELYSAELTDGETAEVIIASNNVSVVCTGSQMYGIQAGFATVTGYHEKYGELKYICFTNDSIKLSDGNYKFPGDLNGNNKFDAEDVTLLRNIIKNGNLSDDNKKICDINGDGEYDDADVQVLNKIVTEKLITINDIEIEEVKISTEEAQYDDKTIYSVFAWVKPDKTTQSKEITYNSNNTSIATVDKYGKIKVLKAGTVKITATASNGVSASETFTFTEDDITDKPIIQTPKYNVTFKNWDGTLLNTQTVEKGKAATAPTNPTREGYTFKGWDKSFDNITENIIVTAQFEQNPLISYTTHVQRVGWQNYVSDGKLAGTSGQGLRLEGIKIKVNSNVSGGIEYSTHVQNIGWQDWVKDNEMSGTSGKGLRLEAIKIKLTGEIARKYDVYYRVHAQHYGWLDWAKNGGIAGTAGYGYRLEGIQIMLVKKGAAAPGSTANHFYKK